MRSWGRKANTVLINGVEARVYIDRCRKGRLRIETFLKAVLELEKQGKQR
jgi:hypothetical protein